MLRFIGFRILQLPLILAIIYFITFALCWIAPGDPFNRTDKKLPPVVEESLRAKFHAQNWYTFLIWYPRRVILHGDFGPSMSNPSRNVNDQIQERLPVSVALGAVAMVIAISCGVMIGTLAAIKRDGPLDWFSLLIALIGTSVPGFVAAALLAAAFAVHYRFFPADGWVTGRYSDMVLPAVALSLLPMAYIARLTRVSMIDVLGSDFVRTARAKGVSNTRIIWKHCLRNAILPVVSYIGPACAATFVGSFVVERVFNIPGLGRVFVDSVLNRDQTLILGSVLIDSSMILGMNFLADLVYSFVDPRIEVAAD